MDLDPQNAYDAVRAAWQQVIQNGTQETAPLLGPDITQQLECLFQYHLKASPTTPGPPRGETAYLLAWVHWTRWLTTLTGEEKNEAKAEYAEEIDRAFTASWRLRDLSLAPEALRLPAGLFQQLEEEGWTDPKLVQDYAGLMFRLALQTKSTTMLHEADRRSRQALRLVQESDETWPIIASNRAAIMLALARDTGDYDDLNEAVLLGRQALSRLEVPPEVQTNYTLQMAQLLLMHYEISGQDDDLAEAIEISSSLLRDTEPTTADIDLLDMTVTALQKRYERTSDPNDLTQAIEFQEQLVAQRGEHNNHYILGQLLSWLFSHTGNAETLNRSIRHYEHAWTLGQAEGVPLPSALNGLAWMLNRRFEQTGNSQDRDAALLASRQAISLMTNDHPALPSALGIFTAALHSRAQATGSMPDLREGLAVADRALQLPGVTPVNRAIHLFNKAALVNLHHRNGWRTDNNELELALWREAIELLPAGHPKKSLYRINLIGGLISRFRHTDEATALNEAINVGALALAELPPTHPYRAALCSNYALTLFMSAQHTPDEEKLRSAITLLNEALTRLPADHPATAILLLNRGTACSALAADGSPEGEQDWAAATRLETAPPYVRITAAARWARNATARVDHQTALTAYTLAVDHLTNLVDPGLERGDKEQHLLTWNHLTADATAAALDADDPESALALLDSGRCVQWNARLQSADELARLAETHPDLAASVRRLMALLSAQDTLDGLLPTIDPLALQDGRQNRQRPGSRN
ncbi:hypothetical protein ACFWCA_36165 [Streptomyces phaeochromogenes]|uniref:hypothetical protein n=1 Tax=Streptomyces phaeochromogenes TaxID=1923 RepID=UPI0036AF313F